MVTCRSLVAAMVFYLICAVPAFSQGNVAAPPKPPKPSPEQVLQERLQPLLAADDATWGALCPRIQKVLALQQQRERFGGNNNGKLPKAPKAKNDQALPIIDLKPDPKTDPAPDTVNGKMAAHFAQLAALASIPDAQSGEMRRTLTDYRTMRTQSNLELAKAREQLRELVTVRQEVVLVVLGILD